MENTHPAAFQTAVLECPTRISNNKSSIIFLRVPQACFLPSLSLGSESCSYFPGIHTRASSPLSLVFPPHLVINQVFLMMSRSFCCFFFWNPSSTFSSGFQNCCSIWRQCFRQGALQVFSCAAAANILGQTRPLKLTSAPGCPSIR